MDLYVKRQWPLEVALALITKNPATALKARHVLLDFGLVRVLCACPRVSRQYDAGIAR